MPTVSTFTPITSQDDIRLVTLIGLAMSAIESLAIEEDNDPDTILARELYLVNKQVHEVGTHCYLEKLASHYPLLRQALS